MEESVGALLDQTEKCEDVSRVAITHDALQVEKMIHGQ